MSHTRIFNSSAYLQPSAGEPIRSVVTQSPDAVVVAWHVEPGQRIAAHTHPHGQDTWTILAGSGLYQLDAGGSSSRVTRGDVVVARTGCVHGVYNDGTEPLVFISVVSPAEAGFELV